MNRRRRSIPLLGVGALLAVFAAACTGDDGPDAGQARLQAHGLTSVTRADGSELRIDGRVTLEPGDVATVVEGTADLSFADGTVLELRVDRAGNGSSVEIGDTPTLLAGDALVVEGEPAHVVLASRAVTVAGKARLDAEDGVFAVYRGRGTVAGGDDNVIVEALRSVRVADAPSRVRPLAYDAADVWDRRFLGDAMQFGQRLEALARGYTADLQPGEGRTTGFFELVLPALEEQREFTSDLLDADRAPGETLVGASIAVQGLDGDFRTRWREVFTFRDDGAAWGLVALDQKVNSAPLLRTLELAVGGSPLSDAPPAAPGDRRPSDPPPSSTPSTAPPTTVAPPPDDDDPPEDPELPPVPDDPTSPLLDPLLEPLVDPLDRLLGGLFGSLGVAPPESDDPGRVEFDDDGLVGGLLGLILP